LTGGIVGLPGAPHGVLAAHASALKALGRKAEALPFDRQAAAQFPQSAVAWHNLAATLDDLGRSAEAMPAVERALALGLDAPETWLVCAHTALNLLDTDRAERAYVEVLKRRPADAVAAQELARLIWVRTGDSRAAAAPLERARAAGVHDPNLVLAE